MRLFRMKIKYKQKKYKNGNYNFRPACFCMGIYRKQRRTAHLLQKRNRRRRKILRCLVCHLILAGILYCRRKVFYSYYRRLCIRFHIGSHYEAKDICKIQILKKRENCFRPLTARNGFLFEKYKKITKYVDLV